ncbi:MAG TPA: ABC transporter ATP-binding protein [candidate division Zixibacteria bacterium]|nr:ABC transporter ATP-binding protein [candidate division Zixibacteria bacterium]
MDRRPLLSVEQLTFRYRRAAEPALRDVWFTLDPGEVLLVAGPSGCGKSTLIRAINGLIPHSYRGELSGRVLVDGRSTVETPLRELATLVGTVLQDPARQIVASTVQGELAFGPENLGMPRDEIGRRMARVAADGGIQALLDRTTDELSGGELQQVAVAGALMLQPRLLVLDEPLANLDAAAARRLLALTRRLAEAGTGIIIVEHRIEDVLAAEPDRVLYLEEGAVAHLGDIGSFFERADPQAVKLPFEVWTRRAAGGEVPLEPEVPRREVADAGGPPRLEWREVSAAYDGREVLHGVSAALDRHEIVAVLGPNGSGKTTLFKTGNGLLARSGGAVLVDGRPIDGRSVADLATTLGYVFQNPSQMLFAPTVREEILFGPRNLGRDPASFEQLLSRALRRVGLDQPEVADRPPRTLSFGQQKRLSIAVALALQPRSLVLDEPSAGQDHRNAVRFMKEVRRIEGLESVYFVTHDADLALANADRILLVRDGRIVADGAPLEVIADRGRWEAANLRYTSLMEANLRLASRTGRFLDAAALAQVATAGQGAVQRRVGDTT